jgi:hypothetical protein
VYTPCRDIGGTMKREDDMDGQLTAHSHIEITERWSGCTFFLAKSWTAV